MYGYVCHSLYRVHSLCAKVVHVSHCGVPVHDPDVAIDTVTVICVRFWIRIFRVFLVLGEDQVLDMGVEWDLRVQNFRAESS